MQTVNIIYSDYVPPNPYAVPTDFEVLQMNSPKNLTDGYMQPTQLWIMELESNYETLNNEGHEPTYQRINAAETTTDTLSENENNSSSGSDTAYENANSNIGEDTPHENANSNIGADPAYENANSNIGADTACENANSNVGADTACENANPNIGADTANENANSNIGADTANENDNSSLILKIPILKIVIKLV